MLLFLRKMKRIENGRIVICNLTCTNNSHPEKQSNSLNLSLNLTLSISLSLSLSDTMTILITLNKVDITYNWFYLHGTFLITVDKKHLYNVEFIDVLRKFVTSKAFISIVIVSSLPPSLTISLSHSLGSVTPQKSTLSTMCLSVFVFLLSPSFSQPLLFLLFMSLCLSFFSLSLSLFHLFLS